LNSLIGIAWTAVSAVLFGSQFVPSKYCPDFKPGAYNISMAFGIMAGSLIAFPLLGLSGMEPLMAVFSLIGGMIWVTGNYLLIVAVARAGMARSFSLVNFSAVFSFLGGAFLGELTDVSMQKICLMIVGVEIGRAHV
jgi:glucose uptake protein GlcU